MRRLGWQAINLILNAVTLGFELDEIWALGRFTYVKMD